MSLDNKIDFTPEISGYQSERYAYQKCQNHSTYRDCQRNAPTIYYAHQNTATQFIRAQRSLERRWFQGMSNILCIRVF